MSICAEVSRPVSRVVTLLFHVLARLYLCPAYFATFCRNSCSLSMSVGGTGAKVKTRENVEKKCYNARDRAGYSATLDAAGLAALNPRASGNGALLLNVSRRVQGGARLCV